MVTLRTATVPTQKRTTQMATTSTLATLAARKSLLTAMIAETNSRKPGGSATTERRAFGAGLRMPPEVARLTALTNLLRR